MGVGITEKYPRGVEASPPPQGFGPGGWLVAEM